jgi:hypothetical protein
MTPEQKRAVAEDDCPFCGARPGQMCVRVEATYSPPLPPLTEPHPARGKLVCAGCQDPIVGGVTWVTVTQAQHVISIPAHAEHRNAARANTLADRSWQTDQSHYSG